MWCPAEGVRVECVELSGGSACPQDSSSPTSSLHPASAAKASLCGWKTSRGDAKPAATQLRLCFAPIESKVEKPVKRRARKGDADHQEWCASAFDVVETTRDEDGRPVRITVQCLLCKRRNIDKQYTVLSEGKKDRKSRPSVTWSGPKRHVREVHNLHTPEALAEEMGRPWNASRQMVLSGTMHACAPSWGPRTKEWNKAVSNVARYIAAANLPYHIAQTGPFMHFMRQFMPQWPRISKQTITRAVTREAQDARLALAKELREVHSSTRAAMTADMWSSRRGDSCITTTVHWVDTKWVLQRRMLGECVACDHQQRPLVLNVAWF